MSQHGRSPLNRAIRETTKLGLRRYGEATAGTRSGPDFVIIGAKRGGSTSLHRYVAEHPSILPLFPRRQHLKGIHYYDSNYGRGLRWYRSHFPVRACGRALARPGLSPAIAGDASPYYLFHPLAAERLARDFPDIQIIVTLRNPIDRAYSHYKEAIFHGRETLSFEDALDAEEARMRGEAERIAAEPGYHSFAHEHLSYLSQSRYLDMLPRWFSLFGRDKFHIMVSEEFYSDPDREVRQVWQFLGLPQRSLVSRTPHNQQVAPDIGIETRRRLEDAMADHNMGLEELLGRPLPWPATTEPVR